jgi:hypothetical protein
LSVKPKYLVMAGLDPATQPARVRATEGPSHRKDFIGVWIEFPARTDVRALGGRVKPGHDELFAFGPNRTAVGSTRP